MSLMIPMKVAEDLKCGNVLKMGCPMPALDTAEFEYKVNEITVDRKGKRTLKLTMYYIGLEIEEVVLEGQFDDDSMEQVI